MDRFLNRYEAGKVLAEELNAFAHRSDVVILALPRGGVPVAYEIAKALVVPLDVFIVRKLGVPGHEELAMGAIATGGVTVFNDSIVRDLSISTVAIQQVTQSELAELKRRELLYRGQRPFPILTNKSIILVDDGIATGATIKAAIKALRQQKPASIIVAIPVAALSTYQEIAKQVEKIICPLTPSYFSAVGEWYENFSQTTDDEVFELLKKINHATGKLK